MVEKKITADDVVRRVRRVMTEDRTPPVLVGSAAAASSPSRCVGFRNPMSAVGDLIRGGASGAAARLGIGTTGQVLTVVAGVPSWAAAAAAYSDEQARDAIGAALVAGSGITVTVNDPSDTITIASTVSAGAVLTPNWLTGRYYGLQEAGVPSFPGGAAVTANRLYLVPLLVPKTATVDRIGIWVGAAVATSNVRLGIYGAFNAGGTASLILDAGTIDSSTTGNKELTISQALSAGVVYLAAISNGAANVLSASGWNAANLHGQANVSGTDKTYGWVKDGTGGYTALPSTFTVSGATTFGTGPIPMVRAT